MSRKRLMTKILCLGILIICLCSATSHAAMIQLLDSGLATDPMFNTTALAPNPDFPDLSFSETDLNTEYNNIYGMPSPNKLPKLIWGENQETSILTMVSDGSIDVFQEYKFLITGDYWRARVNFVFNPSTAVIFDPNDEITMDGFLQHFGKLSAPGIPHPGDEAAGPMISYDMLINAGNKVQTENPFGFTTFAVADNFAAIENHPSNSMHEDVVLGVLGANVRPDTNAQISFRDEIEGFWIGAVFGNHSVIPEPATFFIFAGGLAGAFMKRRYQLKK